MTGDNSVENKKWRLSKGRDQGPKKSNRSYTGVYLKGGKILEKKGGYIVKRGGGTVTKER